MLAFWSLPMKSLILTVLYLAKDTVHRWFTRMSSPLARILVVYFLTLCALASLGGYVISTKLVRDKIIRQGGNMVVATLNGQHGEAVYIPSQQDIRRHLGADSYVLHFAGSARQANGQPITIYTSHFSRLHQLLPLMAPSGGPTLLQCAAAGKLPPGPSEVTMRGITEGVFVRNLPEDHPLIRIMRGSGLLVQRERLPDDLRMQRGSAFIIAFIFDDIESSNPIMRVEEFLRTYKQLEGLDGAVISALPLLREMDLILGKQTQCRIAFCVGISSIVGILLTALAGMEYRQNEYIYTLMKSFGIHPLLLVGAFITENLIIVGASFAGAIATFMYFQRMIVTQILKLGNYTLTLREITPEIALISYTLLGCILLSSIPIFIAALRPIGRVLK